MFSTTPQDLLAERIAGTDLAEVRRTAREAVGAAATAIVAMRERGELNERFKNPRDLVTAADLRAEEIVLSLLRERFPADVIVSEESCALGEGEAGRETARHLLEHRSWVLDPIDGTVNYAHGSPLVGISLGFGVHRRITYGIVALPFMGLVYEAALGAGAHRNGASIQVSSRTTLAESLVATGFPYERTALDPLIDRVRTILMHCQDLRRCGAASIDLCFVAEGTFEAYVESVQPWDMAAGLLIAQEAGAHVGWCSPDGNHYPPALRGQGLLVAAPGVFPAMMGLFGEGAA